MRNLISGNFENGIKIDGPTPLNPGDEIRMCNRQLVFLSRADAPEVGGQNTQAE